MRPMSLRHCWVGGDQILEREGSFRNWKRSGMKRKESKGVYIQGKGVGERSFPLMIIIWPLNRWLKKKLGRIYGRSEKRRVL